MPSSRLRKILADLARHRTALDFDNDGLGDAMLDASTKVIVEDFEAGVSPDGTPWKPLSAAYLKYKQRAYITTQMGFATMAMAGDHEEFHGLRFISSDTARQTFGTTAEAREHADWFSQDRPFYELNARSIDAAMHVVDERFRKSV